MEHVDTFLHTKVICKLFSARPLIVKCAPPNIPYSIIEDNCSSNVESRRPVGRAPNGKVWENGEWANAPEVEQQQLATFTVPYVLSLHSESASFSTTTTTPSTVCNFDDISLAAVKLNGITLQFVPTGIANYKDVALSAVEQNGMALQFVPTDIANYKDVALSAVAQNCIAFTFIPKDLKYVSRASMMVI